MINACLDRYLSFINTQGTPTAQAGMKTGVRRAVSIFGRAGCGMVMVAERLLNFLQQHFAAALPAPATSKRVTTATSMTAVIPSGD